MKKYLFFGVIVLLSGSVCGQNIKRHISWQETAEGAPLETLAQPSGAYVNDEGLPVYQEIIELDASNERIEIVNPIFELLPVSLNKSYPLIQEQLSIASKYIRSKGEYQTIIEFVPLIREGQTYKKLVSFDIQMTSTTAKSSSFHTKDWKSSSVLSAGKWVKIRTSTEGIHKITYAQLQSWGFSNPASVCLYGNGGYILPKMNDTFYFDDLEQNAILHAKDGQGNDCIFFYSTGTVRWNPDHEKGLFSQELNDYSDYAYYFLSDQGNVKNIGASQQVAGEISHQTTTFDERIFHEMELENLTHSGRRWFGEKFSSGQSRFITLTMNNPVNGEFATVLIEAAGRSGSNSKLDVTLNGSGAESISFFAVNTGDAIALYADLESKLYEVGNPGNSVNLELRYGVSNSASYAWLDFVTVNYKRKLDVDDQLLFRDLASVGPGNITEFQLTVSGTGLQIWDVTDFTSPETVPFSTKNNQASFKVATDKLLEFAAFRTSVALPEPEWVGDVSNQNLHQLSGMDMVIIVHPDFLNEANSLAQFHEQTDQLDVEVVTPPRIYNEFSGGAPDVAGIRNFLKMLYDQTNSSLKYVLLFGDGSYDNKNISGQATNYILTYQSPNSLLPTSSFVTDDFFVLLDDGEGEYSGLIDLGIGRIPANTTSEAKIAVDKIKSYASANSLGEWRNVIAFIGDDEDANTHMSQAESLETIVNETNPAFYTDKIYFDAYEEKSTTSGERYPEVTEAINNRVKEGVLILNYTGHANETALAHEKVLGTNEIDNWSNYDKLPIFVTATCEISRFDADEKSGGGHILFNANGGGIGLFSTTRVVYSTPNFILNKEFYQHVFSQDINGNKL